MTVDFPKGVPLAAAESGVPRARLLCVNKSNDNNESRLKRMKRISPSGSEKEKKRRL